MKIIILTSAEDFLKSLKASELAKSMRVIELLEEFSYQLGMPHSKSLANGLFELRIRGKRELRITYCFHKNQIILLHAFVKKTQKTPQQEINYSHDLKKNLHKYNL